MTARSSSHRWSQHVTQTSDAMTLEEGVFKKGDPKAIARSVKRSATRSTRRKSEPVRSAISMLTFYINRAGQNLEASRRKKLEAAKDVLKAEAAERRTKATTAAKAGEAPSRTRKRTTASAPSKKTSPKR